MAAITTDLEIWIDDQDEPILVRADQRDMAAFEVEYRIGTTKAIDEMSMTFFRYLGWHAARRTGKIQRKSDGTLPDRDEWLDTVIGVEPVDEEETLVQANPTTPAA